MRKKHLKGFMFRTIISLVILIGTIDLVKAEKEALEERFKTYRIEMDSGGDYHKGGPFYEMITVKNRNVTIFTPKINEETLSITPRPEEITKSVKFPGKFFIDDTRVAIESFEKLTKEYRDCINSKKWPKKTECLKNIDICFGKDYGPSVCDWDRHEKISECAPQIEGRLGLLKCLKSDEDVFNLFSKCFEPNTDLLLMFNIYGANADRRNYYTLDSSFYTHATGQIYCRFTVMNNKEYQLVQIDDFNLGRPGLTMIPKELFVKDNYYELFEVQKIEKNRELKEKSRTGKKR